LGKIIFDELFAGRGHTARGTGREGVQVGVEGPKTDCVRHFQPVSSTQIVQETLLSISGSKRSRRQENGQIQAEN